MFKSIKYLILLKMVFFTYFVYATDSIDNTAQLQQIAKDNVIKAKEIYENKFTICFAQGEKNKVAVNDLIKLGLTKAEAKDAIIYLSSKNYRNCVKSEASNYSVAVNLARYFDVKGYSLKDDPELKKSYILADDLAIKEMKYQPNYFKINQAKRTILENNPKLKKVFSIKL